MNWYSRTGHVRGGRSELPRQKAPASCWLHDLTEAIINYYKHHLGDYAANTRHLSLLEHGVYRCLIDIYYISEAPLPKDLRAVCRLVCARSKDEREAVELVLEEFFLLTDEGWSNSRCDLEIEAARAKSEKNKELGRLGGRPKKTQTETVSENNPNGFQEDNQTVSENNPSHKPLANSHKPEVKASGVPNSTVGTPAGQICARLKSEARMADMNPSHPKLVAMIAAGLTADEIVSAGIDAVSRGKGFLYALATAEGRRRDADASSAPLPNARASPRQTIHDQRAETIAGLTGRSRKNDQNQNPERDITGESVRVA